MNNKGKKDLKNRRDIECLVNRFYQKVRKDPVLGPIFNSIITDWPQHLELLANFWERQLFMKPTYQGNPLAVHQQVDARLSQGITSEHFGYWLNLWFETLDELFKGDMVGVAKTRAQKMSTMFMLKIYEHRKK